MSMKVILWEQTDEKISEADIYYNKQMIFKIIFKSENKINQYGHNTNITPIIIRMMPTIINKKKGVICYIKI